MGSSGHQSEGDAHGSAKATVVVFPGLKCDCPRRKCLDDLARGVDRLADELALDGLPGRVVQGNLEPPAPCAIPTA